MDLKNNTSYAEIAFGKLKTEITSTGVIGGVPLNNSSDNNQSESLNVNSNVAEKSHNLDKSPEKPPQSFYKDKPYELRHRPRSLGRINLRRPSPSPNNINKNRNASVNVTASSRETPLSKPTVSPENPSRSYNSLLEVDNSISYAQIAGRISPGRTEDEGKVTQEKERSVITLVGERKTPEGENTKLFSPPAEVVRPSVSATHADQNSDKSDAHTKCNTLDLSVFSHPSIPGLVLKLKDKASPRVFRKAKSRHGKRSRKKNDGPPELVYDIQFELPLQNIYRSHTPSEIEEDEKNGISGADENPESRLEVALFNASVHASSMDTSLIVTNEDDPPIELENKSEPSSAIKKSKRKRHRKNPTTNKADSEENLDKVPENWSESSIYAEPQAERFSIIKEDSGLVTLSPRETVESNPPITNDPLINASNVFLSTTPTALPGHLQEELENDIFILQIPAFDVLENNYVLSKQKLKFTSENISISASDKIKEIESNDTLVESESYSISNPEVQSSEASMKMMSLGTDSSNLETQASIINTAQIDEWEIVDSDFGKDLLTEPIKVECDIDHSCPTRDLTVLNKTSTQLTYEDNVLIGQTTSVQPLLNECQGLLELERDEESYVNKPNSSGHDASLEINHDIISPDCVKSFDSVVDDADNKQSLVDNENLVTALKDENVRSKIVEIEHRKHEKEIKTNAKSSTNSNPYPKLKKIHQLPARSLSTQEYEGFLRDAREKLYSSKPISPKPLVEAAEQVIKTLQTLSSDLKLASTTENVNTNSVSEKEVHVQQITPTEKINLNLFPFIHGAHEYINSFKSQSLVFNDAEKTWHEKLAKENYKKNKKTPNNKLDGEPKGPPDDDSYNRKPGSGREGNSENSGSDTRTSSSGPITQLLISPDSPISSYWVDLSTKLDSKSNNESENIVKPNETLHELDTVQDQQNFSDDQLISLNQLNISINAVDNALSNLPYSDPEVGYLNKETLELKHRYKNIKTSLLSKLLETSGMDQTPPKIEVNSTESENPPSEYSSSISYSQNDPDSNNSLLRTLEVSSSTLPSEQVFAEYVDASGRKMTASAERSGYIIKRKEVSLYQSSTSNSGDVEIRSPASSGTQTPTESILFRSSTPDSVVQDSGNYGADSNISDTIQQRLSMIPRLEAVDSDSENRLTVRVSKVTQNVTRRIIRKRRRIIRKVTLIDGVEHVSEEIIDEPDEIDEHSSEYSSGPVVDVLGGRISPSLQRPASPGVIISELDEKSDNLTGSFSERALSFTDLPTTLSEGTMKISVKPIKGMEGTEFLMRTENISSTKKEAKDIQKPTNIPKNLDEEGLHNVEQLVQITQDTVEANSEAIKTDELSQGSTEMSREPFDDLKFNNSILMGDTQIQPKDELIGEPVSSMVPGIQELVKAPPKITVDSSPIPLKPVKTTETVHREYVSPTKEDKNPMKSNIRTLKPQEERDESLTKQGEVNLETSVTEPSKVIADSQVNVSTSVTKPSEVIPESIANIEISEVKGEPEANLATSVTKTSEGIKESRTNIDISIPGSSEVIGESENIETPVPEPVKRKRKSRTNIETSVIEPFKAKGDLKTPLTESAEEIGESGANSETSRKESLKVKEESEVNLDTSVTEPSDVIDDSKANLETPLTESTEEIGESGANIETSVPGPSEVIGESKNIETPVPEPVKRKRKSKANVATFVIEPVEVKGESEVNLETSGPETKEVLGKSEANIETSIKEKRKSTTNVATSVIEPLKIKAESEVILDISVAEPSDVIDDSEANLATSITRTSEIIGESRTNIDTSVSGPSEVIGESENTETPVPGPSEVIGESENTETPVPGPSEVVGESENTKTPVPGPSEVIGESENIEAPVPQPVKRKRKSRANVATFVIEPVKVKESEVNLDASVTEHKEVLRVSEASIETPYSEHLKVKGESRTNVEASVIEPLQRKAESRANDETFFIKPLKVKGESEANLVTSVTRISEGVEESRTNIDTSDPGPSEVIGESKNIETPVPELVKRKRISRANIETFVIEPLKVKGESQVNLETSVTEHKGESGTLLETFVTKPSEIGEFGANIESAVTEPSELLVNPDANVETFVQEAVKIKGESAVNLRTSIAEPEEVIGESRGNINTSVPEPSEVIGESGANLETSIKKPSEVIGESEGNFDTSIKEASEVTGESEGNIKTSVPEPSEVIRESKGNIKTSVPEPSEVIGESGANLETSIKEPSEVIRESGENFETSIKEPSEVIGESIGNIKTSVPEPSEVMEESGGNIKTSVPEPSEEIGESEANLETSIKELSEANRESEVNLETSVTENKGESGTLLETFVTKPPEIGEFGANIESAVAEPSQLLVKPDANIETFVQEAVKIKGESAVNLRTSIDEPEEEIGEFIANIKTSLPEPLEVKGNSGANIDTPVTEPLAVLANLETAVTEPTKKIGKSGTNIQISVPKPSEIIGEPESNLETFVTEPTEELREPKANIETPIKETSKVKGESGANIETSIPEPSEVIEKSGANFETSITEPSEVIGESRGNIKTYVPEPSEVIGESGANLETSIKEPLEVIGESEGNIKTSVTEPSEVIGESRGNIETSVPEPSEVIGESGAYLETFIKGPSEVIGESEANIETPITEPSEVIREFRANIKTSVPEALEVKENSGANIDTPITEPLAVLANLETAVTEPTKKIGKSGTNIQISVPKPSETIGEPETNLETFVTEPTKELREPKANIETPIKETSKVKGESGANIETLITETTDLIGKSRPNTETSIPEPSEVIAESEANLETSIKEASEVIGESEGNIKTSVPEPSEVIEKYGANFETSITEPSEVIGESGANLETSIKKPSEVIGESEGNFDTSIKEASEVIGESEGNIKTSVPEPSEVIGESRGNTETPVTEPSEVIEQIEANLETFIEPTEELDIQTLVTEPLKVKEESRTNVTTTITEPSEVKRESVTNLKTSDVEPTVVIGESRSNIVKTEKETLEVKVEHDEKLNLTEPLKIHGKSKANVTIADTSQLQVEYEAKVDSTDASELPESETNLEAIDTAVDTNMFESGKPKSKESVNKGVEKVGTTEKVLVTSSCHKGDEKPKEIDTSENQLHADTAKSSEISQTEEPEKLINVGLTKLESDKESKAITEIEGQSIIILEIVCSQILTLQQDISTICNESGPFSPQEQLDRLNSLQEKLDIVKSQHGRVLGNASHSGFTDSTISLLSETSNDIICIYAELDKEKERVEQLMILSEEYELTLKEFSHVIEVAENLLDAKPNVPNLESLKKERQTLRKFFGNLKRCQLALEKLEFDLDPQTKQSCEELHKQLYTKSCEILDKASFRKQQLAVASGRWTKLNQTLIEESKWIETLHKSLPVMDSMLSFDCDNYCVAYQAQSEELNAHQAKLMQLNVVASNILDVVESSALKDEVDHTMNSLRDVSEKVTSSLGILVEFKDSFTNYKRNLCRLNSFLENAESKIESITLNPDSHPYEFWELKAQFESMTPLRDEALSLLDHALKTFPVLDEGSIRENLLSFNDRWNILKLQLQEIEKSSHEAEENGESVSDVLDVVSNELDSIRDSFDAMSVTVECENDLYDYLEKLQILKAKVLNNTHQLQSMLSQNKKLNIDETERIGILLNFLAKIDSIINEELDSAQLMRDKFSTFQRMSCKTKRLQDNLRAKVDQWASFFELSQDILKQAIENCQKLDQEVNENHSEIEKLREILKTFPSTSHLRLSTERLDAEVTEMESVIHTLIGRIHDLEIRVKHQLGIWQDSERALNDLTKIVHQHQLTLELLLKEPPTTLSALMVSNECLKVVQDSLTQNDILDKLKKLSDKIKSEYSGSSSSQACNYVQNLTDDTNQLLSQLELLQQQYIDLDSLWKQIEPLMERIQSWTEEIEPKILQNKVDKTFTDEVSVIESQLQNLKSKSCELSSVLNIHTENEIKNILITYEVNTLEKRFEYIRNCIDSMEVFNDNSPELLEICRDEANRSRWEGYKEAQQLFLTWLRGMDLEKRNLELPFLSLKKLASKKCTIQELVSKFPEGERIFDRYKMSYAAMENTCSTKLKQRFSLLSAQFSNLQSALLSWRDRLTILNNTNSLMEEKIEQVSFRIQSIQTKLNELNFNETTFAELRILLRKAEELHNEAKKDMETFKDLQNLLDELADKICPIDIRLKSRQISILSQRHIDLLNLLDQKIHRGWETLGQIEKCDTKCKYWLEKANTIVKRLDGRTHPTLEAYSNSIDNLEIEFKNEEYQSLVSTIQELANLTSGKEKESLKKHKNEIKQKWNHLKTIKRRRKNKVDEVRTMWSKTLENAEKELEKLMSLENYISEPPLSRNLFNTKEIQKALEKHNSQERILNNESNCINDVLNMGEEIVGECEELEVYEDALILRKELELLQKTWNSLVSEFKIRNKLLKSIRSTFDSLNDDCGNLDCILAQARKNLDEFHTTPNDSDSSHRVLQEVGLLLDSLGSLRNDIHHINQTSRDLIQMTNTSLPEPLNRQIKLLEKTLNSLAAECSSLIDSKTKVILIQDYRKFQTHSVERLASLKEQVERASALTGSPEIADQQLNEIKKKLEQMSDTEERMLDLEEQIIQADPESKMEILKQQKQYAKLKSEIVNQLKNKIEDRKPKRTRSEATQVSTLPIHTESTPQMSTMGDQSEDSFPINIAEHPTILLGEDYVEVSAESSSRINVYKHQLDQAIDECRGCVAKLESILEQNENSSHDALIKNIGSSQSSVDMVEQLLMFYKETESEEQEMEAYDKVLEELKHRVQEVQMQARNLSLSLRDIGTSKKVTCPVCSPVHRGSWDSTLWRLQQWLQHAESTLKEAMRRRPPDDLEQLETAILSHAELVLDLDSHRTLVNSLKSIYSHLSEHEDAKEEVIGEVELRQLKCRLEKTLTWWNEVCHNSAQWMARLQIALRENSDFDQTIQEFEDFIVSMKENIKALEPVDLTRPQSHTARSLRNFQKISEHLIRAEPELRALLQTATQLLVNPSSIEGVESLTSSIPLFTAGSSEVVDRITRLNHQLRTTLKVSDAYVKYLSRLTQLPTSNNDSPDEESRMMVSLSDQILEHERASPLLRSLTPQPSTNNRDNLRGDNEEGQSLLGQGGRYIYRAFRASLPLQAFILLLLGASTLIPYSEQDFACNTQNTLRWSFLPMLEWHAPARY